LLFSLLLDCAELTTSKPLFRGALDSQIVEKTLANGLNFTLTTPLGDLDLLGEVASGGTYERLLTNSM
jgi:hypothetical protein